MPLSELKLAQRALGKIAKPNTWVRGDAHTYLDDKDVHAYCAMGAIHAALGVSDYDVTDHPHHISKLAGKLAVRLARAIKFPKYEEWKKETITDYKAECKANHYNFDPKDAPADKQEYIDACASHVIQYNDSTRGSTGAQRVRNLFRRVIGRLIEESNKRKAKLQANRERIMQEAREKRQRRAVRKLMKQAQAGEIKLDTTENTTETVKEGA